MGLWNILERVCSDDIPIMIINDYNIIVEGEKKNSHFLVNQKSVILNHLLQRLDFVTLDLLMLSVLCVMNSMDLWLIGSTHVYY